MVSSDKTQLCWLEFHFVPYMHSDQLVNNPFIWLFRRLDLLYIDTDLGAGM